MHLPGYIVESELYRGRKRLVLRGRREADGVPVIIKTFVDELPPSADADALRREHDILESLSRVEGVVRTAGVMVNRGRPSLVLLDGGGENLKQGIPRQGLPLNQFLELGVRLATTLAELHQSGVIHRDINPHNLVLDQSGQRLTVIDFGLATRGPSQAPRLGHPNGMEGTVAYISPEQTGRTNREVDYRTDCYSLGVTLFEMLTGRLPFESGDPLEVIHCHIARSPPLAHAIRPDVPEAVSAILLKLLAKTPEDRYQSALGLRADLEACQAALRAGAVPTLTPGSHDFQDRFVVPQQLYGRSAEVAALRKAFDRVLLGPPGLLVVAGYSGVGKTSLVRELYQSPVGRRGYFIEGKFDQLRRLPFGALIQAFRELVRQLLTEGEEQLSAWRARLSEALGSLGGIVAEVIPEIELILGPQAASATLGASESQSRFRLVFQRFMQALSRKEHPLVVFLDDLQWADSATLDLLAPLLTSPDIHHLFLIGAYRDNEVDAAHPLLRTLTALEQEGVRLDRLNLQPLGLPALSSLIEDTLHRGAEEVAPLARLVLQKTEGNPFFVIQFLKALHDAGLVVFDHEHRRWTFNVSAIAGAGMTDNVIELMTRKIRRLGPRTQAALTLGACIGNQFDAATLAVISSQSPEAARQDLQEALEEGLLLTASWSGRDANDSSPAAVVPDEPIGFLHDRVQQAAYALIPEERRQSVHLTVGRLLLARWNPEASDERLFDIVQHLNLGRSGITDPSEALTLARLNLAAGRKAKNSTAYQAADGYLRAGLSLLAPESWDAEYELTYALHLEAAEVAHLCGAEDSAEALADVLLQRAQSRLDQSRVHVLQTVRYEYLSRYPEAIRAGRRGLALFGEDFPDGTEAREAALAAGQAEIDRLIGGRSIASLIDLPPMTDPETRAVMKLLTGLHTPCYLSGDKTLTMLNTASMVRLSLCYGHLEDSAHAYVLHAMVVGPILGRLNEGFEFGQLAIRLSERFGDPGLRAKVHMNFSWNVSLWQRPFQESQEHARLAFRLGNESGRISDAVYALFNESYFTLLAAPQLSALDPLQDAHVLVTRRWRMDFFADGPQVIFQWGRALQGRTVGPTQLSDGDFDEAGYLSAHAGQRLFLMFFYVAKLALHCLHGEYRAARSAAHKAGWAIEDYTGTIWDELRTFYLALTLASLHDGASEAERVGMVTELHLLQKRLAHWAEHSPANFLAQHLLVSAEIARVESKPDEAARFFEQAISEAGLPICSFERALANERYALFLRGRGMTLVAEGPWAEARMGYAEWGATAKVSQLASSHVPRGPASAALGRARGIAAEGSPTEISAEVSPGTLDLVTVMKAARALSGEVELEVLLEKLMLIAIENAGAERGVLVLEQQGTAWVRAEGSVGISRVYALGEVPLTERDVAPSIVTYVRRTSESVVLADARADGRFGDDPYLIRARPRSVLCTPVINQGRPLGVLYLENNLIPGAFTADRTQVLQVLAAHAAIAIENARMFSEIRGLKDRLQAENVYLIEEIKTQHGFEEIVGRSPPLHKVLSQVEQVAPTDTTVLVTGETGTGKELVARALHNLSRRKDRPLVTVNCGAISAGLVESELFGHEKGAFTGAINRKIGRFELADGGTIFLDEIGDLPADLQVKLLRVLQEGEIERVGGARPIKVNTRVIAATHRDLQQLVHQGRFRADLFYRLNVFPIHTPALRERREDIPLLVRYFVLKYAQKLGKRIESIPVEIMEPLCAYDWPGNIRELGNVLERSVIVTRGPVLELGDWIPTARPASAPSKTVDAASLEDVERAHIISTLERAGWKVSGANGAAAALGLKPTTLESRMKKLGIRRP